jgi:rare lipoprotein A
LYQNTKFTAAHRTLPFGTEVKVTNLANGKSVTVRINDRGPYAKGRLIDLSKIAAKEIGLIKMGVAKVKIEYNDQQAAANK